MIPTWQSIVSGGGVAIFAFVLAMLWDIAKSRRDEKKRDTAILLATKAELETLVSVARNNLNLVTKEMELLKESKRLVNPLDPLEGGFWDLVKLNPPKIVLKRPETLSAIREVSRRTDQIAEMIRSREAFRISNQALGQFNEQMVKYDELLVTFLAELMERAEALQTLLDEHST